MINQDVGSPNQTDLAIARKIENAMIVKGINQRQLAEETGIILKIGQWTLGDDDALVAHLYVAGAAVERVRRRRTRERVEFGDAGTVGFQSGCETAEVGLETERRRFEHGAPLMCDRVGEHTAVEGQLHGQSAVGADGRPMLEEVIADSGYEDFVVAMLGPVVASDAQLSARLALWGRRLVGEALTQAQRIGIERAFLGALLGLDEPASQQAVTAELFAELTRNHSRRMNALGLTA